MRKFLIYSFLMITSLSCTAPQVEGPNGGKVEVSFCQNIQIGSRTAIGDNGSASWSIGDQIALWAKDPNGAMAFTAQPFKLHHFKQTFDQVVFSAIVDPLTAEQYTYYATYPVPTSVSGNIATFYLPATQSGSNELGSRDIMVARPATGAALTEDEIVNLNLGFTHKMHSLRMQLADSKLNGADIDKIILEFPTDVVGDVMVDVTNPDATPTLKNSLDYITVLVPKGYKAGDYIWATIFPANLTGEVSYRVCAGEYTSQSRSLNLDKQALPQRVTPMSMSIPDPVTTVYIEVTGNNLGEEYNSISIYNESNTLLGQFSRNSIDQYYLNEDVTISSNQKLIIKYESINAIVSTVVTAPTIQIGKTHRIESVVPYLLFEDGSGIHTNGDKADSKATAGGGVEGTSLDDYMNTKGWNAARFKVVAGKSMRTNVRHESTMGVTRYTGRIDTPTMGAVGLKEGANVNLQISFSMGAYANSSYGSNNDIYCVSGVHTNTANTIDGVQNTKAFGNVNDDYSRVSGQFSKVYLKTDYLGNNYTDDSFNADFPSFSYTAIGCGTSTRFCWIPCCVQSTWTSIANAQYYIYIDNIKVKIAQ